MPGLGKRAIKPSWDYRLEGGQADSIVYFNRLTGLVRGISSSFLYVLAMPVQSLYVLVTS